MGVDNDIIEPLHNIWYDSEMKVGHCPDLARPVYNEKAMNKYLQPKSFLRNISRLYLCCLIIR